MLNRKKAQLGQTMTWIVATIIIIVTLIIFIYTSSLLAKTSFNIKGDLKWKGDFLEYKTASAFEDSVVGDKNKDIIENWIEEENK